MFSPLPMVLIPGTTVRHSGQLPLLHGGGNRHRRNDRAYVIWWAATRYCKIPSSSMALRRPTVELRSWSSLTINTKGDAHSHPQTVYFLTTLSASRSTWGMRAFARMHLCVGKAGCVPVESEENVFFVVPYLVHKITAVEI